QRERALPFGAGNIEIQRDREIHEPLSFAVHNARDLVRYFRRHFGLKPSRRPLNLTPGVQAAGNRIGKKRDAEKQKAGPEQPAPDAATPAKRSCGCFPNHVAARLYSMSSSARKRMFLGGLTPMARAVLRLTASCNLCGSSIGNSAGFAPRKIMSTSFAPWRPKAR